MRKLANSELQRKSIEEFKNSAKTPLIIVLDNVRSLHNVGSVFRTADAFLLESIYLCGITGTPPNKEIQKTALGASESVDWKYFNTSIEALQTLRKNEYKIYAIEQAENAILLNKFDAIGNPKIAIVFGNEVKGVSQEVINNSNGVIEIPQIGTKHSLNISVSVGIVCWHLIQPKLA